MVSEERAGTAVEPLVQLMGSAPEPPFGPLIPETVPDGSVVVGWYWL